MIQLSNSATSTATKQRMIPGGSNKKRLTNAGTTSFVPTSVSFLSLLSLTMLPLILQAIKNWSRGRPGNEARGSNDKRLTDVDTHNHYICKVPQYLTSREALLHVFTYALVYPPACTLHHHEPFLGLLILFYICTQFGCPCFIPFLTSSVVT